MKPSPSYFVVAAFLSFADFFLKTDHHFDFIIVAIVGVIFMGACLLSFRPAVSARQSILFMLAGTIVWLVLFVLCFNLLFVITSPLAGLIGAWIITVLFDHMLNIKWHSIRPILITGLLMPVAGILFAMLVKKYPDISIGIKAGVITALWQLGVGIQLTRQKVTEAY